MALSSVVPGAVCVIYHGECADGFGAAYAAWRRFGDSASYRGFFHGQPLALESLAGQQVIILDFSFPPTLLVEMAKIAKSVLQLDHHATARDAWAVQLGPATDGLQTWSHPDLPLTVSFAMEKSGVRLAWEHFHPETPMPWPLRHVEDQDIWRFALPATRAFNRALRLQPFEFAAWDSVMLEAGTPCSERYEAMLAEGEAIERFYQGEVERLANGPLVMPVHLPGKAIDPGHAQRHGIHCIADELGVWRRISGLAINANGLFASELGDRLARKCGSFGLIWSLTADGEVRASLRARGHADVAHLAERYGGGGHRNAAGFRMPLARFLREILGCADAVPPPTMPTESLN